MNTKNTPAPVSEPAASHPDALPDGTFSRSTMKRRELLIPGETSSKLVDAASGEGDAAFREEAFHLWSKAVEEAANQTQFTVVEIFASMIRRLTTTGQGDVEGYYIASFKRGRDDGTVMWWMPDNRGYSHDLEQAGIYAKPKPGYHDNEYTVPVPAHLIERLRVRRVVDFGDAGNEAFHNAKALREWLAPFGQQQEGQG